MSDLRVEGTDLVNGGRRQPIAGTARRLGAALDVAVGKPEGLYRDTSGVSQDEPLVVDAAAAAAIASWFATGEAALRTAFDGVQPILWPEHFDLGVTVDEVTYGVSPGDALVPQPYAYVGPWQRRPGRSGTPRSGPCGCLMTCPTSTPWSRSWLAAHAAA